MADNYVCTLDEASIKKAKKELNEDPADRLAAVEALRKLLKEKNPHIKCPTDTRYLLQFLRARKFSQLEAKNLIENHLIKKSQLGWFTDLDPKDPGILALYKTKAWLAPRKRDKEGRRIFFIRPQMVDPKKINKLVFFRALASFLYFAYLDEQTQVNGTVSVFDMTGFSILHQQFLTMEDRKNMLSMWQKAFPARIKEFHLYNGGTFLDFILMVMKLCMTDKMQKRVITHGSNLESLYEHISMDCLPEEYLPDDYEGPNAGTEDEIVAAMIEDMTTGDTYERVKAYSSSQWKVDLSSKPCDVPQASFRKLNVD